jgi:hypothetical protein
VTLPLLFTYSDVKLVPKKLTVNGSGTAADELSSPRPRSFAAQPVGSTAAPSAPAPASASPVDAVTIAARSGSQRFMLLLPDLIGEARGKTCGPAPPELGRGREGSPPSPGSSLRLSRW